MVNYNLLILEASGLNDKLLARKQELQKIVDYEDKLKEKARRLRNKDLEAITEHNDCPPKEQITPASLIQLDPEEAVYQEHYLYYLNYRHIDEAIRELASYTRAQGLTEEKWRNYCLETLEKIFSQYPPLPVEESSKPASTYSGGAESIALEPEEPARATLEELGDELLKGLVAKNRELEQKVREETRLKQKALRLLRRDYEAIKKGNDYPTTEQDHKPSNPEITANQDVEELVYQEHYHYLQNYERMDKLINTLSIITRNQNSNSTAEWWREYLWKEVLLRKLAKHSREVSPAVTSSSASAPATPPAYSPSASVRAASKDAPLEIPEPTADVSLPGVQSLWAKIRTRWALPATAASLLVGGAGFYYLKNIIFGQPATVITSEADPGTMASNPSSKPETPPAKAAAPVVAPITPVTSIEDKFELTRLTCDDTKVYQKKVPCKATYRGRFPEELSCPWQNGKKHGAVGTLDKLVTEFRVDIDETQIKQEIFLGCKGMINLGPINYSFNLTNEMRGIKNEAASQLKTPKVDLKADKKDALTVAAGSTVALSWTSRYINSCVASGAWNGGKAKNSGKFPEQITINQSGTYILTCGGAGGAVSDPVTITVADPTPVIQVKDDEKPSAPTPEGKAAAPAAAAKAVGGEILARERSPADDQEKTEESFKLATKNPLKKNYLVGEEFLVEFQVKDNKGNPKEIKNCNCDCRSTCYNTEKDKCRIKTDVPGDNKLEATCTTIDEKSYMLAHQFKVP